MIKYSAFLREENKSERKKCESFRTRVVKRMDNFLPEAYKFNISQTKSLIIDGVGSGWLLYFNMRVFIYSVIYIFDRHVDGNI